MKRLQVTDLPLDGLKLVKRLPLGDARGSLTRVYCSEELGEVWGDSIAQINHTFTAILGTVRGMHYQLPPHSERKLVSCLRGKVWDVAVDLRRGSPTFLQWHGEKLSAENGLAMFIPEGFAHGFQTLTDDVEMLYLHSSPYAPSHERGLNPKDGMMNILWPLDITTMSDRDASQPMLEKTFEGVSV